VKLTPTSYIVLGLVRNAGRATPYDLKVGVAGSVGNFWTVPHSQIYAEPERLARAGLLQEEREAGGRRRRTYTLTEAGQAALGDWIADPHTESAQLREPALLKLFFGADPTALASGRLAAHRERLAAYREIAANLEGQPGTEGPMLTLRRGIQNEEGWIAFWEDFAA
jgi:PadR family transcriptional regulator AphA